MLKPTIALTIAASLLVAVSVACGGASEEPAAPTATAAQSQSAQPSQQQAPASGQTPPAAAASPVPTIIATATPSPTNTPSRAQETSALGGRLRIATIPPVQQLTGSWLGTTTSANTQVRPFTDPLVHTDRFDGSLVPGLATSWEANDDGTQWTFFLRDDVDFHGDWGQFTAHDVPVSASFIVREDAIATDTGLFRGLFGDTEEDVMASIVAVDDNTVQFNLNTPNSLVDFFATAQQGNLFMYSRAQYEAEGIERL